MCLSEVWYIMNSYHGKRVCIKEKLDTSIRYYEQLPRGKCMCLSEVWYIMNSYQGKMVWIEDKLDISWTDTKGKGYGWKTNFIYHERLQRGKGMDQRQTWYIMNSYQGERVWIKDKLDISWIATKGKGYGLKTNLIYHEQLPRGNGMDQRQTWYIMNSYQGERVWIKDRLDMLWIATRERVCNLTKVDISWIAAKDK